MSGHPHLQQLLTDRRQSSLQLLRQAVQLCHQMAADSHATVESILEVLAQLKAAHPAMALFENLFQRLRSRAHEGASPTALAQAAEEFLLAAEQHSQEAAYVAAAHLPTGSTVLTHSSSSQIRSLLLHARRLGKQLRLLCTVSEPGREGILLARWAHAQGFPVLLLAEAQVGAFLREIHLFLVGSDALCSSGLIHKVGTALLAYRLWLEHRPTWVVSCSEKLLPRPWGEELSGVAPPLCRWRIPQAQPLYDCTPWEHLAVVFTERGAEEAHSFSATFLHTPPAP
jgi:translation initiation factor 2B subunit (eIF-2B alpha/beta/delta family)